MSTNEGFNCFNDRHCEISRRISISARPPWLVQAGCEKGFLPNRDQPLKNASLSCLKPGLYVHPICKASNVECRYLDIQLYLHKSYPQDTPQHAQLSLDSGFVLLILTSITTFDVQHAGPFRESFVLSDTMCYKVRTLTFTTRNTFSLHAW